MVAGLLLTVTVAALYLPVPLATAFSVDMMSSSVSTSKPSAAKVIDSHLHVWASRDEAAKGYPYAEGQDPPQNLADREIGRAHV